MNIIYVKLGIGTTEYSNQRIGLFMDLTHPAEAVNYDDMDSNMMEALNELVIIQISLQEYNDIIHNTVTPPNQTVSTDFLLTLADYITGCPAPGDAFFLVRGNKFFKIRWQDMKDCIGYSPREIWRVGDPGKPVEGDDTYSSDIFAKEVTILWNGSKIYKEEDYDPEALVGLHYYTQDKVTKTMVTSVPFGRRDLIEIIQGVGAPGGEDGVSDKEIIDTRVVPVDLDYVLEYIAVGFSLEKIYILPSSVAHPFVNFESEPDGTLLPQNLGDPVDTVNGTSLTMGVYCPTVAKTIKVGGCPAGSVIKFWKRKII